MATTTQKKACSLCGAPITNKAMSACYACGTPYSFGEGVELAPREVRFDEIEKHPRYAEVRARRPSLLPALGVLVRPLLVGVALLVVGRLLRAALSGPDAGSLSVVLSWLLSLPLVLGGVAFLLFGLARMLRFVAAPWVVRSALVTRKRTILEGGNLREAEGKPLIVHLEFRTENKEELRAAGPLASRLQVQDIGVAFVKGPFLLDYVKLP